jgi:hypothetical protein
MDENRQGNGSPILGLMIWLEQTYGADLRGDKDD